MGGNDLTIDTSGAGPANITISTIAISGAAGSDLTKTGTGVLTLNVASTFIGSTTITGVKSQVVSRMHYSQRTRC